ncbi:MAG: type II toxin-antitoxin system Phd/YefM family antitoxin [Treponema sp.]|uniref:type II toxin-antitoxin system Phd/YefM family antitoxin n=1 Tax=Treponema sp. TaxID=166 RepID=UPI003FA2FD27
MVEIPVKTAGANLNKFIAQTQEIHKPIIISGTKNRAVLISEEDWNAVQETLYLCSIPGMRESLIEASREPLKDSVEDIGW